MGDPECADCDQPATHYEKDSSPRRFYCGRHAARWARRGVHVLQAFSTKTSVKPGPEPGKVEP